MLLNETQVQVRVIKYAKKQLTYYKHNHKPLSMDYLIENNYEHHDKEVLYWIELHFTDKSKQMIAYWGDSKLMESDFIKLGKALERMDGVE